MASSSLWQRFQQYLLRYEALGFGLDISRMKVTTGGHAGDDEFSVAPSRSNSD